MQTLIQLPAKLEIEANQNSTVFVEQINNTDIFINENSELTMFTILTTGWTDNLTLNFHLQGRNSKVKFIALIVGSNEESFPFSTNSIHTIDHTDAFYFVRSGLFDAAKIDYQGTLIIKKAAQLTNSYLSHHSLMLSAKARTNTTPSLEIEADDVKAGHSATIGNVDEETLFYLQSRGISQKDSKRMMIRGFMEHDLKEISDPEARNFAAKTIEQHLDKLLQ